MQVNKTGFQPNFQAKFIKNQAAIQMTKDEINNGRDEELIKVLNDMDKHHRNVALLISRNENGDTITNLYNGNKCHFTRITSHNLESLNNIKSTKYKQLFVGDKIITQSKTEAITNQVANKFFIKSAPDYSIGHKVDATY